MKIRFPSAPPVEGCRWCGVPYRAHSYRWVPSRGWHAFATPTPEQINARLRVRLNVKRSEE